MKEETEFCRWWLKHVMSHTRMMLRFLINLKALCNISMNSRWNFPQLKVQKTTYLIKLNSETKARKPGMTTKEDTTTFLPQSFWNILERAIQFTSVHFSLYIYLCILNAVLISVSVGLRLERGRKILALRSRYQLMDGSGWPFLFVQVYCRFCSLIFVLSLRWL